jgi:hypothetical protein
MRWPPASGSQQDATTASTSSPTAGCTVANDPVAQTSLEPWTVIRTPEATDRQLAASDARSYPAMPVLMAATLAAHPPRQSPMVPVRESTPARTSSARRSESSPPAA